MSLGLLIAFSVLAFGWLIAVVIVVLDSPLPSGVPGETGLGWLKRFKERYPGPKTWILVYGGAFWAALLMFDSLFRIVRAITW